MNDRAKEQKSISAQNWNWSSGPAVWTKPKSCLLFHCYLLWLYLLNEMLRLLSSATPSRNMLSRAVRSIKRASSSSSWPTWSRTMAGTEGRAAEWRPRWRGGRQGVMGVIVCGGWVCDFGLADLPLTSVTYCPSTHLLMYTHTSRAVTHTEVPDIPVWQEDQVTGQQ